VDIARGFSVTKTGSPDKRRAKDDIVIARSEALDRRRREEKERREKEKEEKKEKEVRASCT
jgi:hypothetical protein